MTEDPKIWTSFQEIQGLSHHPKTEISELTYHTVIHCNTVLQSKNDEFRSENDLF